MAKILGPLMMSLVLSACEPHGEQTSKGYRDVPVPAELLASNDARARGRQIFEEKCALCHGARADGKGVRQQGLSGQPVNFRSSEWRAGATPRGVYMVLSEGKRGTSMPAWPTLSDRQKWEVVAYVLNVTEHAP